MKFLKVPRGDGEKTRRALASEGLLSKDYAIISEGDFVFLPITDVASGSRKWKAYEVVERKAQAREIRHEKLKDALSGFLGKDELESLVASFDLIGDIAIIEIPEALEKHEAKIGEALLCVHKNLKTVLKKLGPMEGEYRTRKLKCIAGEDRTETIYKESGVRMRFDVAKVYFSVRLATERKRIADLVQDGEKVLVMFAGVGPFALVIAKNKPNSRITAVELNPEAVRYMKENIALNKMQNIEAVEGDVKKVFFDKSGYDRVIMPLPKGAHEFLDVAYSAVKNKGTIHFYTFSDAKAPFIEPLMRIKDAAKLSGVSAEPSSMRIVRPFSPATVQAVIDIIVQKNQ